MLSIVDIAPPQFRFLTAAEWGMTWKRPAVPEQLNDPEAYVHHTAGSRLGQDAVRAFQALNRWAQEGKNYSALDYDIVVHRATESGLVTIGGGREEWMSAATKDRNDPGEAIAIMGYFHPGHRLSEHPHPDEIEAAALGIVWGIENGWIARDARILGHFENPAHPDATGCPGDYFIPHLPTVRARVVFWLAELDKANNPPPPVEEDPMEVIRVKGDTAQYLRQGMFARWIPSSVTKARWADELGFDPAVTDVPLDVLGSLILVGPNPFGTGVTTSPADFGGHIA